MIKSLKNEQKQREKKLNQSSKHLKLNSQDKPFS